MSPPLSTECKSKHGPEVYHRRASGIPWCSVCVSAQSRARRIAAGQSERRQTPEERFWSRVDKSRGPDACWPWTGGTNPKGYGLFSYGGRSARRYFVASRYALSLELGREIPHDLQAAHTCDNPPCCNPAHLFEATAKANSEDSVVKRRRAYGERNGRRRGVVQIGMPRPALSPGRVEIIRIALSEGIPGADIAAFVGCSPAAVSRIRHGSRRAVA